MFIQRLSETKALLVTPFYLFTMILAPGVLLGEEAGKPLARKPYSLFEGMDLQARTDSALYPIVGFSKKNIFITRNGTRNPLSTDSEISYSLRSKLSSKWVELTVKETEPFYSKMNSDLGVYSSTVPQVEREANGQVDYEIGRTEDSPVDVKEMRRSNSSSPYLENGATSPKRVTSFEGLSQELEEKINDPESYADSLRVTLTLESEELLKGVYLVLVARIDSPATEPDSRPLIQIVGQLQPDKKRQVKALFSGLPEGFSLLGLEVHVYSQGEEIPSAESMGLKMLTEEEAFKYSLGQYKDKRGRVEPVLFRSLRAEAISSFISEKELMQLQANLIIHPDGSTTLDYLNTPSEPLTDKVVGILEEVRFIPAIVNGEPTESKITLKLSQLVD